jgi:hypothetical protein
LPDGRDYHWKQTDFVRMSYAFLNDVPVLTFTFPHRFVGLKIRVVVTVEPGARSAERDLPLPVLLGCHLTLDAIAAAMQ